MKEYWKTFHYKINGLTLRERRLMALISASAVAMILVMTVWLPIYDKWMEYKSQSDNLSKKIAESKNRISKLESRSKLDLDQPYKDKLNKLKIRVEEQNQEINELTSALIGPNKMNLVFKGLLAKNKLTVEELKNSPPEKLEINKGSEGSQILYKHELAMELIGDYFSSLNFVGQIENEEWQLYWNDLSYEIIDYPAGSLKINVHTLSTSNKVLGL
ncbi:hypothetical protein NBRC116188_14600 [Oceaniserpentilla sp. 4NH20-0058]|uniref:hypothetical protein n=1 Tax=Oceaniserpentilla sp. 4NH20-0058 TaxID=3127660 RepID=UPI00310AB0C0